MIRTQATLKVAAALLTKPDEWHWGYSLHRDTGVHTGTLYPMLERMRLARLLHSKWQSTEDMEPSQRLPRRYYALTDKGRAELSALIERAEIKR